MESVDLTSCVRGYHVYQDRWAPVLNERLSCKHEPGNLEDPYAVAIVNAGTVVGHVPRKISTVCCMFLRKGGTIECTVTGSKQYSADLKQGGMEIPCKYSFRGETSIVQRLKKVIYPVYQSAVEQSAQSTIVKVESNVALTVDENCTSTIESEADGMVWLSCEGVSLSVLDRNILRCEDDLNDKLMDFGQQLIKTQFPKIRGLKSTLIITKFNYYYSDAECENHFIQIIHAAGNHWVVASNIGGAINEVTVYDSLYKAVSKPTSDLLKRLMKKAKENN